MHHWRLCCLLLLLQLLPPMASSSASLVRSLPGFTGDLPFHLETGYIGVGEAEEVQLFYYFVESQRNPSQDPIMFWQAGGPGCSGLYPFFLEQGPLKFKHSYDGKFPELELNPYSWTQVLNIIFIDLPIGTGFSYSKTQQGYYTSDTKWVDNAYDFLQKWFTDHPDFASNPLYIAGSSYAGIPVPPLVQKVYEGNKESSNPRMNLKGYVLASPFGHYPMDKNFRIEYANRLALIPDELYESLKVNCNGDYLNIDPNNTKCVSDYQTYSDLVRYITLAQTLEPDCVTVGKPRQGVLSQDSETTIQSIQDPYNFWCRSMDEIPINNWANDEKVRDALHVRKGTRGQFELCNSSLACTNNIHDVVGYHHNLTYTNLQSLIYCADLDLSVPHTSTQSWIRALNLTIADPWRAWFVEGQVAGYTEIRSREDEYYLTYAAVKGAGHVAQAYKPKEVFDLIEKWFSYSVV